MTAGSGVLHEEMHSANFTRQGGPLEMVQLWVNLPAQHKLTAPRYQALMQSEIPAVELPDGAGTLRVIAGDYAGRTGPAKTFTPMRVMDLHLTAGSKIRLELEENWTAAVVVLHGTVAANGSAPVREAQLVQFQRQGRGIEIEANNEALLLLLTGAVIDEPVVGHGPFVMNSREEILQAMQDFNAGLFGQLSPSV